MLLVTIIAINWFRTQHIVKELCDQRIIDFTNGVY
jgi:hypothetical protein